MKKTLNHLLNLILPPRCIGTGDIVAQSGLLSAEYWQKLHFVEQPYCDCCGIPFETSLGEDMSGILCSPCLMTPPIFDKARSALIYEDYSRKLILSFKYGDKLHTTTSFGIWLNKAAKDFMDDADLIIPVPLHAKRLWWRRFNQSALLADALSSKTQIPHRSDVLIRARKTKQHKDMKSEERQKNVAGAFGLRRPTDADIIKGKNIILIDDVFTTGATLNACSKTLKAHGAGKIYALTLARVLL